MERTLSKEQFMSEYFALGPENADPGASYNYLVSQFISNDVYTFDHKLVTFDVIVKKYKEYKRWWEATAGKKDPKYLRKDEKFVNIYNFLVKSMYDQTFKTDKNDRDYYLFGDYDLDKLGVITAKANEIFRLQDNPKNKEKKKALEQELELLIQSKGNDREQQTQEDEDRPF